VSVTVSVGVKKKYDHVVHGAREDADRAAGTRFLHEVRTAVDREARTAEGLAVKTGDDREAKISDDHEAKIGGALEARIDAALAARSTGAPAAKKGNVQGARIDTVPRLGINAVRRAETRPAAKTHRISRQLCLEVKAKKGGIRLGMEMTVYEKRRKLLTIRREYGRRVSQSMTQGMR